jgi:hypothetical protein
MACGIAMVFGAARTRGRTTAALGLLVVLAGYFGIFVGLVPVAAGGQVLPTALFFGSLAIFRLMSRFESR